MKDVSHSMILVYIIVANAKQGKSKGKEKKGKGKERERKRKGKEKKRQHTLVHNFVLIFLTGSYIWEQYMYDISVVWLTEVNRRHPPCSEWCNMPAHLLMIAHREPSHCPSPRDEHFTHIT